MRILQVIDGLFVGGAERLLIGLCSRLQSSGFVVEVYALRSGGPLEAELRDAGIPLYTGGGGSVYAPLHVFRLAKFLLSRRFDVIHVHLYPAQLWVCLAASLAGCKTPLITTEHSTQNRRRTFLFRWLDRWMFRQFAAIVAISEATRQALADHAGRDLRSLSVVLNGIDERQFGSLTKRTTDVNLADPKILTVGSLTTVKDQATAIRALALLENGKLSIVGDGPQRGALEALAAELGVQDRVQFLGTRLDIPQLIAASDIYVQPSRWEGFCLAVVEAMAGGLPCVASRVDGLEEVIGPAGLFFEAGNARELAACLRILGNSYEQRARLAALGVERARKFSLSACAVGYENLYKAVTTEL